MLALLRFRLWEYLILQVIWNMNRAGRIFYTSILKNSFYCVTFQKWVAKLPGFAIINAWQHFGNRKSASHNK